MTRIEADPQDPKSVKVGSTHWRLWQSDSQDYYATRGAITLAQEAAGYKATIFADTPDERQELMLVHSDPLTSED